MPELPEVETTARGLRAQILGTRVTRVGGVDWPRIVVNATEELLQAVLQAQQVTEVGRRGKYLTISFDTGPVLVLHRKMSGNVLLTPSDMPIQKHTHLIVTLSDGRDVRLVDPRKFSRVYLFESTDLADVFFAERLGIDPLVDLTLADLRAIMGKRSGRLKSVLLDQTAFPGMGNLYCDEALWRARVHPLRTASSLTRAEMSRLFESIRGVLEEAVERRGTSFSDYLDQNGEKGSFQEHLNAYGQEDKPCPRCGKRIKKFWLGARGTHVCPSCQRMPRQASIAARI
jgi:formamidopyrimidine-DNA glycosylase